MNDDADLFMSADEAAATLGVSLTTLYAYVSRKGIRSEKMPGSKSRRYWRVDVEKARSRGGQGTPLSGGLIRTTALTLLTSSGIYYRGVSAVALSETATLEETAGLLWNAPEAFDGPALILPEGYQAASQAFRSLPRVARAIPLLTLIEQANPRAHDLSAAGYARSGAAVIRCFAAIVGDAEGPTSKPIHQVLAQALGLAEGYDDLIRRLLVLAADHELDPTTYAVRAAANTGVTPYGAAVAGLVAARGRRLHQGRAEHVSRFVDEVLNDDPQEAVLVRFRGGEPVPGFGHYVHADRDPRAEALVAALERCAPAEVVSRLKTAIGLTEDLLGQHANFILPAMVTGRLLGLKGEEMAVAAVGRMVGWIANALEQYQGDELFRPRATYAGTLPR